MRHHKHTARASETRGPSQRQLRAGELLRHALAELFMREDLRDPALKGVSITVTEVRASPDLKHATVFFLPLGGEHKTEVLAALNKVAPYLRGLLGRKIELKFTPALVFRLDETFDEAARVDALLASPEVKRDL